jgi:hypothetical protein
VGLSKAIPNVMLIIILTIEIPILGYTYILVPYFHTHPNITYLLTPKKYPHVSFLSLPFLLRKTVCIANHVPFIISVAIGGHVMSRIPPEQAQKTSSTGEGVFCKADVGKRLDVLQWGTVICQAEPEKCSIYILYI